MSESFIPLVIPESGQVTRRVIDPDLAMVQALCWTIETTVADPDIKTLLELKLETFVKGVTTWPTC